MSSESDQTKRESISKILLQNHRFNEAFLERASAAFESFSERCDEEIYDHTHFGEFACVVNLFLRRFYGGEKYEAIRIDIFDHMVISPEVENELHFIEGSRRM